MGNIIYSINEAFMQEISNKEWQEKVAADDQAVILDVRTDEEVAEGIIPGAQQIDIQNPASFMQQVQELDKSKNYYVYCRAGGRSAQACAVLDSLGAAQTFNLSGGFSEWDGAVEQKRR